MELLLICVSKNVHKVVYTLSAFSNLAASGMSDPKTDSYTIPPNEGNMLHVKHSTHALICYYT